MTSPDDRVLFDVDSDKRIATITLNNPGQHNSYDATMRDAVARYLDRVAGDDDITVVLLRGADGVFSTGADMNNAYGWYGDRDAPEGKSRPSQRRRLTGQACDEQQHDGQRREPRGGLPGGGGRAPVTSSVRARP